MPEPSRPLLVMPVAKAVAARQPPLPRGKQARPNKSRLIERLEPRFAELQSVLNSRAASLAQSPAGVAPEQVVVFETTAPDASKLVAALKNTDTLSWLATSDLEDLEPDDDYYDKENKSKLLTARLFIVMANHAALGQLVALWKQWISSARARLPDAYKSWGAAFGCLRDVRLWSVQDRLEETGLREYWEETKEYDHQPLVEIELWARPTQEDRDSASKRVRLLVAEAGGTVRAESVIETIHYHGILAQLPATLVETLLTDPAVGLIQCNDVQLIRPTPQQPHCEFEVEGDVGDEDDNAHHPGRISSLPPTVALLDGLPLQNHDLLRGHLIVDDPDNWEADYPAAARRHCTAMASLLAHGDRSIPSAATVRPIYVRPILRPRDRQSLREEAPQDELWIDVIHRAVVRILGSDLQQGTAPTVKIINLSVGDRFRPFLRDMSPLARLVDWLSWRYQVLFVVSAGNHTDGLVLEPSSEEEEVRALRAVQRTHHQRRLLCPAEAINALTVGAVHSDGAGDWTPRNADEVELIATPGTPSPLSALGRGYKKSVKPDLLAAGGRAVFQRGIANRSEYAPATNRHLFPPGLRHAAPRAGASNHEHYSVGTSNAAVLVTRAGMQVLEIVEQLRAANPELFPFSSSLLTKCLLVHTATWNDQARFVLESALKNPQNQANFRDHLAAFIGYGEVRSDRALECAVTRATLVGGGTVSLGAAVEHRVPLPSGLNAYTGPRRVAVTLAWFSPIRPSTRNYRVAALDVVTRWNNADLAVDACDVSGNAAKRGTLQHSVLAGTRSAVNVLDSAELVLTVNAAANADGTEAVTIPYALAVSVELPATAGIPVYDQMRTLIRDRARANIIRR